MCLNNRTQLPAMVEPYGPNILTTDGEAWKFHRRITSPCFNEENYDLVFRETLRQAKLQTERWESVMEFKDLRSDIETTFMNINLRANFGVPASSGMLMGILPEGHRMTFQTAMATLVRYFIQILVLPGFVLRFSPWRRGYMAWKEFDLYMHELIASQKSSTSSVSESDANLLAALLKNVADDKTANSEADKQRGLNNRVKKSRFKDQEVMGNVFAFLLAGGSDCYSG